MIKPKVRPRKDESKKNRTVPFYLFYGKRQEDLLKRGKGKLKRQIAIYLSKVLSGEKNIEVGGFFGIKGPAVSGVIKTIEGRLDKEKRLKREIERLKEMIINE